MITPGVRLRGITLIEALVSLLIAALLLAMLSPVLRSAGRGLERSHEVAARAELIGMRSRLRRGFARVSVSAPDDETAEPGFIGGLAEISFAIDAPVAGVNGAARQQMTLAGDSDGVTLTHVALSSDGEALATSETTAPGATLTMRYLQSCADGGLWVEDWSDPTPPLAFRATITGAGLWPDFTVSRLLRAGETC